MRFDLLTLRLLIATLLRNAGTKIASEHAAMWPQNRWVLTPPRQISEQVKHSKIKASSKSVFLRLFYEPLAPLCPRKFFRG